MDTKQKIYKLNQRSLEIAMLALTLLPIQNGASASNQDKNINDDKKVLTSSKILL